VPIANTQFFGFGPNERDDLLHMMFLTLCLGPLGSRPEDSQLLPLGAGGACITFNQFTHGLSLVGNPSDAAALKPAMEAFEAKIRSNYTQSPSGWDKTEGAQPGAYRRFWDNMYWVLSCMPGLKCPVHVSDDFKKKDLLFVDCLKLAFDLLPADHPHKESFLKFMLEVKAPAFRAQAADQLSKARSNLVMIHGEAGYQHYVKAFSSCSGTLAFHEWNNIWMLSSIGPAPEFRGWRESSVSWSQLVQDYVKSISPQLFEEEEEEEEEDA